MDQNKAINPHDNEEIKSDKRGKIGSNFRGMNRQKKNP